MFATLGGSLALLLGLVVLLVPLLTPELSRARDAVWGAVLLLLGLVLVTSADRLAGSPMLAVLCGALLIGRLGSEVGQQRWLALTPEEQLRLGSGAHWRLALGQVLASLGALRGMASQGISGLQAHGPLSAWSPRSAPHPASAAAPAGARRKGKGGQTKRWVRPEPGDTPADLTAAQADGKGLPSTSPEPLEEPLEPVTAPAEAIPAPRPGPAKASLEAAGALASRAEGPQEIDPASDQASDPAMDQASQAPLDDPRDPPPVPDLEPTLLPIDPLPSPSNPEAPITTTTERLVPPVIEVSSFAAIEALVDAAWGAAPSPAQGPGGPPSAEAMDVPQDQETNPNQPCPVRRVGPGAPSASRHGPPH